MTPAEIQSWNLKRSPRAAPMGAFPVQHKTLAEVSAEQKPLPKLMARS